MVITSLALLGNNPKGRINLTRTQVAMMGEHIEHTEQRYQYNQYNSITSILLRVQQYHHLHPSLPVSSSCPFIRSLLATLMNITHAEHATHMDAHALLRAGPSQHPVRGLVRLYQPLPLPKLLLHRRFQLPCLLQPAGHLEGDA